MYPNGCTLEVVDDDQQGVLSIIQRLGFVFKTTDATPAVRIFIVMLQGSPPQHHMTPDSYFTELTMQVFFL